ncbi:cysteine hydrolase family protein [Ethanoligenens harbinense]|uniref:Isochorismatase hydrolase n=1 Tax=Ethanoligenens harbinense (strain DSM 18485 / JCM 12961 / CGMCC 1.5033 / YUAN-3) TaxID=663278 RepID=E6U3S9_ETHHY|nr:isochorismatase family cysteine hydrolase [Ethanoligenens harbinense]ADU26496.1 isochorismatase hydrolase [Ethanoligenens harbinense YUAN-3]AVQ95622.1 cysteine hydrolase [Ethanoligenens harbinense YUAN-3]AYF38286.1 cysteine hydrolase [Ethanoligenens harbinense]AYF41032.1 cysteine hydrolase [Ethanoligenens harbinense]QCN91863.1 cysteine hydrolase [Ethanoligenens harbinense]
MDKYIEPDFNYAALITIDMQNDFVLPGAVSQVPGTDKILPNMTKLLRLARDKSLTIVHVIRLYSADGSDADLCRRNIIESGRKIACPETHGAEIVSVLKPNSTFLDYANLQKGYIQEISKNEWVIYKSRWGAFYKTNLEKFLSNRRITTLIFSGCNFPNCPRTSIYEASERDFKIVLVMDAISQIYPKGLEEMNGIGVSLLTTDQIEKQLINKK